MNASAIFSNGGRALARHASELCQAAVLVFLVGVSWSMAMAICQAHPSDNDVPGKQVVTRGPEHEAFAVGITFNPEPGVVVTKAPPNVLEDPNRRDI